MASRFYRGCQFAVVKLYEYCEIGQNLKLSIDKLRLLLYNVTRDD